MTKEPMIHTSKGNLPLSSLYPKVAWEDNENETICASELWLGEECVRREVHVLKKTGLQTFSKQGEI